MEKGNIYISTSTNKSDADRVMKKNGSGIMKESQKHIYGDDSLQFQWLVLSRIEHPYSLYCTVYVNAPNGTDPEPD